MGMNILYIEDNPDNMTLVRRVLEAGGHTLFPAATGLEGISVAQRESIDLVLLDLEERPGFCADRRAR